MRAMTAMGCCTEAGPGLYLPNQVTRDFTAVGISDTVNHLYVLHCFCNPDQSGGVTV